MLTITFAIILPFIPILSIIHPFFYQELGSVPLLHKESLHTRVDIGIYWPKPSSQKGGPKTVVEDPPLAYLHITFALFEKQMACFRAD